jgi:hypothetical protein
VDFLRPIRKIKIFTDISIKKIKQTKIISHAREKRVDFSGF